ncbi:MAG: YdcF family protein [Bdellovibrionales bacterium]
MSLTTPLLLIFVSLFLLMMNRRRPALYTLVISAVLFLLIGTGVLPKLVLEGLQADHYISQPDWKKQNAIVLLGAGTVRWPGQPDLVTLPFWGNSRVLEAARLYFSCKKTAPACKVIASGGDPNKNGLSEAETMARSLKELGVDGEDVILESKSHNTFQNAQFSRELIRQSGFEKVYLVTSGFHMQRAQLYFSHFKIETLAAPADQFRAIVAPVPVSFNFVFLDIALHEYGGILQFHLYNFLGWNAL